MSEMHIINTNPDGLPEVEADLLAGREGYNWCVIRCHYCGRQHQHGGGLHDENPETYLGGRVAHCGRGDYILVPSAQGREELGRIRERAARRARGEQTPIEALSLSRASLDAACRQPLWLKAAGLMRAAAHILECDGEARLDSAAWRCADAGALLRLAIERQYAPDVARDCLRATGRGAQLPRLSKECRQAEVRARAVAKRRTTRRQRAGNDAVKHP